MLTTATPPGNEAPDAPTAAFDVFISYSRRDSVFAQKLYKALTSYTPPPGLGLQQRRLRVFLDRTDFTGVDYSQAVVQHLERSSKLLVICSPNARAHSKYVDDEIRLFVRSHGSQHVIPLLLAGIPNNEAADGRETGLAFPPALCEAIGTPLARDFRAFDDRTRRIDKGAFQESWYFLLADIFGKTRAEIEQRDQLRRVRNQRRLLAVAGVLVALFAGLSAVALVQRRAAVLNAELARAQEREATAQRGVAVEQRNLAEANAALAAKNERTAEQRRLEAEEQRASAVDRLARLYLSNAQRRLEQGDPPGALLWYAETLKLRDDQPTRIRVGALLQAYPRLVPVPPGSEHGCDFSPDGGRIACTDGGRTARIWNVATAAPVSPPLAHAAAITTVLFNPNGLQLLTADAGGVVQLWNATTGRRTATLPVGRRIRQALFSPAGDRVLTAGEDGSMRIWESQNGRPASDVMANAFPLRDIRFSPDGTRVATILDDKTVFPKLSVWDAATGRLAAAPVQRPLNGFSIGFANGHDLFYSAQENGALRICDAVSGACRPTSPPPMPVESTRFSADGRLVMVNGSDHTVRVIDVQTGDAVGEDMKHGPAVKEVAFSQDARKILTIDAGATLHLWGPPGTELRAPIQQVSRAWFAPDGSRVAVLGEGTAGSGGSDIRVWKTDSGYPVSAPMRQSQRVGGATFSRGGEYLLVDGASTLLWQVESGGFRQLPDDAGTNLRAVGFGPAGASLLITGEERSVRVWDVAAGRATGPPMNAAGRVDAAWLVGRRPYIVVQSFIDTPGQRSTPVVEAWDGTTGRRVGQPLEKARVDVSVPADTDGHRLIVRMESGQLKAWDLSTPASAPSADLPKDVRAGRFTASGLCIASTAGASALRVSTWPNRTAIGPDLRDTATVEHVRLAPGCEHVATVDKDQRLRIWDTHSGRLVVPRRQDDDQFGFFQDAVFSPDGAWFATQANDGSVRVWSASTGAPRTVPLGYVEFIHRVSFSADGRYVMAEGDDAAVMVWDASTGEQLVDFPTPPFLLHNSTGSVAWSPDARRLVVGAEAFIKDISTISLIVRVQDLAPDSRRLTELAITAQLMAGRKLDESGAFVNLTTAELSALARQASAK
jgi:WD40 repeat protein